MKIERLLFTLALITCMAISYAQPGGGGGQPGGGPPPSGTGAPVDSGVVFLVSAICLYLYYSARKSVSPKNS